MRLFLFQMSGICDLIPGSVIDATMFNPCGYSMNGMKADVSSAPLKQFFRRCWPIGSCDMFLLVLFSPPHQPGNILDYSHHPGTRVLLCQLWDQPLPNVLRWSCQESCWCLQARKTRHHAFCQSGVFLRNVCRAPWLSRVCLVTEKNCLSRAPNVAASFLQPRSLRATSVLTASWPSSTITILSSQVMPSTASRTNRAEAARWRGGKREEAARQTPIPRPCASASPPGVATVAQVAPGLRRPPALIYPPALVVCIVLAVTWISCMKSLLSVLLF